MLAVEVGDMSKMRCKLRLAVNERIPVGKESPTLGLVFAGDAVKQVLPHLLEVPDDIFGNRKVRLAIGRRLETLKCAYLQDTGQL